MKQILIELDDELAARLEQIAPARARKRSEFIRRAILEALWAAEEAATADAYARVAGDELVLDPLAWEPATGGNGQRS